MATITKRSNKWQARIKRDGQRISKTFANKTDAAAWARRIEGDHDRGVAIGEVASTETLGALIERYQREVTPRKRSARNEERRLDAIKAALGQHRLDQLRPSHIVQWIELRLRSVSAQTAKHDLNSISLVIDQAIGAWGCALPMGNPAHVARTTLKTRRAFHGIKARERRVEPGEWGGIIAALPKGMDELACFAVETCMRRGEIVAMDWRDVDLEKRTLHIPQAKAGARTIALTTAACDILRERGVRESGSVWPVTADAVTKAWNRACEQSGVASLRLHDLRHEAVSRLFEGKTFGRKLSIPEAALMSGHSTWSQLQRYTQLQAEDLHG